MPFYSGTGAVFHCVPVLFLKPRAVLLVCPFNLEVGGGWVWKGGGCSPFLPVLLPFQELP